MHLYIAVVNCEDYAVKKKWRQVVFGTNGLEFSLAGASPYGSELPVWLSLHLHVSKYLTSER